MSNYGRAALLNMQGKVQDYDGDFNDLSEMHGQGKATMADGSKYDGQWEHNLRCGYGV